MLKRIDTEHLKLGMHLHKLCGPWISHPFWRTSFILTDSDDIRRIRESGIREVWIDSEKGLDVDSGQFMERAEEEIAEAQADCGSRAAPRPARALQARAPLSEEIENAARICFTSTQAVVSMFREARMGKAIDAESALQVAEEISASVQRNPGALISIARLKRVDDYTYMHSVAVSGLMGVLARQLGLDEEQVRDAALAGLLHDVGKMAIPLEILNKPGKLTDAEYALVKTHSEHGHRMLLNTSGIPEIVLDVCMHHHEKVDGKGYAQGLRGEAISLFAKMGAVCDVYDAVTSNRPYKTGWDPAKALRSMAEWCNTHFEKRVFQAFVKSIGIYPPGTLVRLESGRLGVVMDQSGQSLLTPLVKVFYSTRSRAWLPPELIDLATPGCNEKIAAHEDSTKWRIPDMAELWRGAVPKAW